jgi:hypothetical protein
MLQRSAQRVVLLAGIVMSLPRPAPSQEGKVVFDVGQGYNIRFGQLLMVDGREGEYLRLKTRDGQHVGYIHETRVVAKDPKSYFLLSIGGQKLNVYLEPRCGTWQNADKLYDFETDIGTTPLPLSSIDSMSVTALVKKADSSSPYFKATVTLKNGNQMAGTFFGADFYRGSSEALQAAEGLELKTAQRVPWTIKAIEKP